MIDKRQSGTLLFPFGNLSHTSILYYAILYAEVEYNIFKFSTMRFLLRNMQLGQDQCDKFSRCKYRTQ